MKRNLNLSIPSPCAEKWESFIPQAGGGFCGACSKTVIDFTKMSDAQILRFLKNKPAHTCGRFRADQLKSYACETAVRVNPGFTLLRAGFVGLLLMLANRQGMAHQTVDKAGTGFVEERATDGRALLASPVAVRGPVVKGVVVDETGAPIPGASIVVKGTTQGTTADADGRFQFSEGLHEGDVLVFSFIGYEPREYTIRATDGQLEITMDLDMNVMGAIAVDEPYTAQTGIRGWWTKFKNLF